jgi:hypothetical protein
MYSAKKRAEVAPGVGSETDTFVVTGLGGYAELRDEIKAAVIRAYNTNAMDNAKSAKKAEKLIHTYVDKIINPSKPPEPQTAH